MDLIGPRYLKGGFRYYILNIIDIESHFAGVYPITNKSTESIVPAICQFWSDFSMPDYLQMDNELSFRGSNRHPRSFGALIRLAISQNITPVFIPPAEPWRNGTIEKFNDNVQKYFLNTQTFTCIEELRERSHEFMAFHNLNHRYSTLNGRTPLQVISGCSCFKLKSKPDLNQRIPIEEGEIVFIRFIRSDCIIRVLDARFELKRELMYSYVIARIVVKNHALQIERDNKIYQIFPFLMPVDW
jgi:putative transposase